MLCLGNVLIVQRESLGISSTVIPIHNTQYYVHTVNNMHAHGTTEGALPSIAFTLTQISLFHDAMQ